MDEVIKILVANYQFGSMITYMGIGLSFLYIGSLIINALKRYFPSFHEQFHKYLLASTLILGIPQVCLSIVHLVTCLEGVSLDSKL